MSRYHTAASSIPEANCVSILRVEDFSLGFYTENNPITVVEDVSFEIKKGAILGLVGESGCGKSVTAMSIMRLLAAPPSFVKKGRILFEGENLLTFGSKAMRKIRGNSIGMIFQDPMTSLNPCFSIGYQIGEVLTLHQGLTGRNARRRSAELLDMVGVNAPDNRPAGCYFADRCLRKTETCTQKTPLLQSLKTPDPVSGHTIACWNPYDENTGA